jgi:hypothetical protein
MELYGTAYRNLDVRRVRCPNCGLANPRTDPTNFSISLTNFVVYPSQILPIQSDGMSIAILELIE